MHARAAAFFEFRELVQSLSTLPEPRQILTLEYELFHALERAHDLQRQAHALVTRSAELQAEAAAREEEQDAFARHLHADLLRATRDVTTRHAEHEEETRKLRLALVSARAQRDALDELCHLLVRTIEQAAESEAQTASSESPHVEASA